MTLLQQVETNEFVATTYIFKLKFQALRVYHSLNSTREPHYNHEAWHQRLYWPQIKAELKQQLQQLAASQEQSNHIDYSILPYGHIHGAKKNERAVTEFTSPNAYDQTPLLLLQNLLADFLQVILELYQCQRLGRGLPLEPEFSISWTTA